MFSAATKTDGASALAPTQVNFTASTSWVVPAGVTSVSAVCIGAGGGGSASTSGGSGGAGGDLRYYNNLSVTPGETLTITVGSQGLGGTSPTAGGFSRIARGGTTLLEAAGGGAGTISGSGAKNGTSSTIAGSIGGGDGGTCGNPTTSTCGGGGGAGGYSGAGGNGSINTSSGGNGTGGAGGGGGGGGSSDQGGAGGGVNVFGTQAANGNGVGGAGSTVNGTSATGGSYGDGLIGNTPDRAHAGLLPEGTPFGGGGCGADNTSEGGNGGQGAVRIIWPGTTRQFPATGAWMSEQLTTVINTQTVSTTSITIPASAQAGDLAVLIRSGFTSGAQSTPTGWTQIATYTALTPVFTAWYRILQSGDAGSTVTFTTQTIPFAEMTLFRKASGTVSSVTVSSVSQLINTSGLQQQNLTIPSKLSIAFGCAAVTDANLHTSLLYLTGGLAGSGNKEPSALFPVGTQPRYSFMRFSIYDVGVPAVAPQVTVNSNILIGGAVVFAFVIEVT